MASLAMLLGVLAALPTAHGMNPTVRREPKTFATDEEAAALGETHKVHIDSTGRIAHARNENEKSCMERAQVDPSSAEYDPCIVLMDGCPAYCDDKAKCPLTHSEALTQGLPSTDTADCPHFVTQDADKKVRRAGTVCCEEADDGEIRAFKLNMSQKQCYGGADSNGYEVAQTYAEAVKFCSEHSARLCTALEVHTGKACGAGCGMECLGVWTSTEAGCVKTSLSNTQGARCVTKDGALWEQRGAKNIRCGVTAVADAVDNAATASDKGCQIPNQGTREDCQKSVATDGHKFYEYNEDLKCCNSCTADEVDSANIKHEEAGWQIYDQEKTRGLDTMEQCCNDDGLANGNQWK